MKTTELMIGDWVYYKYSAPKSWEPRKWQVVAFESGFIELASPGIACKPIPLTPEILEKNGFEFVNDSKIAISSSKLIDNDTSIHFQFYDKKDCFFQLLHCGAGSYEIRKYVKYVHELQHALRLCGLNELADNFMIE